MNNALDDKHSADGFQEALNSLSDREVSMLGFYLGSCVLLDRDKRYCENPVEIEAMAGNMLSLEASNARTKFLNYRRPAMSEEKTQPQSNGTDPYKNPYSFWREPSKWFWWNILERGRIHGDE